MKQFILFSIFFLAIVIGAEAQCSMCNAVVESSQKTGSEFAEGLNAGILYLMGIPYALLVFMGILLFRKMNQNNAESDR